jgi:hypothetical protein
MAINTSEPYRKEKKPTHFKLIKKERRWEVVAKDLTLRQQVSTWAIEDNA